MGVWIKRGHEIRGTCLWHTNAHANDIGIRQLARHIGLPWRSAAGAASNTHDMQAASENTMAIMATAMAQATHPAYGGLVRGGLTFGYEKFINDIEVLQTLGHFSKGVDQSAAAMSLDPITEVMPGGISLKQGKPWNAMAVSFTIRWWRICQTLAHGKPQGPYLTRARNIPVAGAVGRIYTTCGLRERMGRMAARLAQMREAGAHRFWIDAVHSVQGASKIGTCFSHASSLSTPRRVLFLASDGNIPVALSKSEGAGSVVALASLPGAHLNIRSSGMRLPDGCYGPATFLPIEVTKPNSGSGLCARRNSFRVFFISTIKHAPGR